MVAVSQIASERGAGSEFPQKEAAIFELDLVEKQLSRMRGMTRYYHERFFADTRYTASAILALFLLGFWSLPEAFLLVPVVALIGANQTAFDASYLFMARTYASALETEINASMRRTVLVGSDLEERYLVPLSSKRVVGVSFGRDFSWFGWMTVFYTLLGMIAYVAGIWLGWSALEGAARWLYLGVLGAMTLTSLGVGWWWFVSGTGQRRLDQVIEERFDAAA